MRAGGQSLRAQLQGVDGAFGRAQGSYEFLDEVLRVSRAIYERCGARRARAAAACGLYAEVYGVVAAEVLANLRPRAAAPGRTGPRARGD